ncbi:MAG TPA: tyrosine-type recombinase/integrase [Armatimonadota bacterium]|nr:tyrosine-type recombinase/integrase [Armatimonadota bacterium]
MKLSTAIQEHLRFQESRGDSASHRNDCERVLTKLQEQLGDLDLSEITAEDLREFQTAVRKRPGNRGKAQVSDLTVLAYHRALSAFFHRLEEHEILVTNPMRRVPRPKVGQYLIKPFTEEQLKKLLEQPDVSTFTGLRDVALMCFLLDTGCRIAECLSLTLEELDLERRTAQVLGKGKKERLVPFGARTLAWMERYLEKRRQDDASPYVFVNQYGEQLLPNSMSHRIAQYGRQGGLRGVRVSPHTFRHTFSVNWLLGNGHYKGDTLSLQTILGHSTPAMTQRYVHFAGQDLRKLHDRLSPADQIVAAPPPMERRRRLR